MVIVQFYACTKTTGWYTSNMWILWYINYILIKMLLKKREDIFSIPDIMVNC